MKQRTLIWSIGVWLALASAVALGGGARAQQPRAASVRLGELEAHALKMRGAISGSDARIQAARARVDAARAAYSPMINLLGEAYAAPGGRIIDLPVDTDGNRVNYKVAGAKSLGQSGAFDANLRFGLTLDARSTLYDFGRTAAAVDAAEAQHRAAQADAQRSERDIVRDVRAAYVRWATAHALWSLHERSVHAAEERQKRALAAIEEGAARSADRTAAEIDTATAKLELERSRAKLESARADLGFLAVFDLPPDARPADNPLQAGLPAAQPVPEDASVRALSEQRRAAKATARVHDHALAPVISASVQAGVQGNVQGNMGVVFPLYRVGLSVVVPLWDGGAEAAQRGEAEARAAELTALASQYDQTRQQQKERGAMIAAQAEKRISLAEQLVRLCNTRLAQLEEAFPLGAARYSDVADARGALSQAETELVLAQALRAEAALELY